MHRHLLHKYTSSTVLFISFHWSPICFIVSLSFASPACFVLYINSPFRFLQPFTLPCHLYLCPLWPFTNPVLCMKTNIFFKSSMQTWFSNTLQNHKGIRSAERAAQTRVGGRDNQLIWSSALGNGERKRSWGTDIYLLGMIELRRERESYRAGRTEKMRWLGWPRMRAHVLEKCSVGVFPRKKVERQNEKEQKRGVEEGWCHSGKAMKRSPYLSPPTHLLIWVMMFLILNGLMECVLLHCREYVHHSFMKSIQTSHFYFII